MKPISPERVAFQELDWSTLEVHEVLEALEVHPAQGLLPDEVSRRKDQYGANWLDTSNGSHPHKAADTWLDMATWGAVLAGAALLLAGWWQVGCISLGIAAINLALFNRKTLVQNSGIGADQALIPTRCRVRRNSRVVEIAAVDLVPGDILVLENGDWIAADARLLESANLRVVETALNGEIQPIDKVPQSFHGSAQTQVKPHNLVYQGTQVVHGLGVATVIRTGAQTELARLSLAVNTSLKSTLPMERTGRVYQFIILIALMLVCATGIWVSTTYPISQAHLLTFIGSATLAAAPLSLPFVFWSIWWIARRRLKNVGLKTASRASLERLATVDVLCTNPTGIFAEPFFALNAADVTGHTISADISLNLGNPQLLSSDPRKHRSHPTLALMLGAGALCNNASLERSMHAPEDYTAYGEPDEGALLVMAGRLGLWKSRLDRLFPRLLEAPYSLERGRMSTLHETRLAPHLSDAELPLAGILRSRRAYLVAAKGDFNSILSVCSRVWVDGNSVPLDSQWKKQIIDQANRLSANGGRLIGVAVRTLPRLPALVEDYQLPLQGFPEHLKDIPRSKKDIPLAPEAADELEREMTLTGMILLSIAPHPEAQAAVEACQKAGLHIVMLTRTNPSQARETSLNLKLNTSLDSTVCEGKQLLSVPETEARDMLLRANVWTHLSPLQRVQAVRILQESGLRVAFTGQDASDRPAMQQAEVGMQLPVNDPAFPQISDSLQLSIPGLKPIFHGITTAQNSLTSCRRAAIFSLVASLALLAWILISWVQTRGTNTASLPLLGTGILISFSLQILVGLIDGRPHHLGG